MDPKITKNILLFLNRVQLVGSEAPALCEAMAALNELLVPATSNPENENK